MHFLSNLIAVGYLACNVVAAPVLPSDGFNLVGYGKENPLGETTGGKGGPTTTVTAIAALATAVKVSQELYIKRAGLTTISEQGTNALNIVLMGNFALSSRLNIGSNKSVCIISGHLVPEEQSLNIL